MSILERKELATLWESMTRQLLYSQNLESYKKLRANYEQACEHFQNLKNEVSLERITKVLYTRSEFASRKGVES